MPIGAPLPWTGRAPPVGCSWRMITMASSDMTVSRSGHFRGLIRSGSCISDRRASHLRLGCGSLGWWCPKSSSRNCCGQGQCRLVERNGAVDTRRIHRLGCLRPACTLDAVALPPPSRRAGCRGGHTSRAVRITGVAAGLQAVLDLPAGTENSVVQDAVRKGLAISGLSQFGCEEAGPGWVFPERDALVVGFAGSSDSAWPSALETLCAVLP